MKRSWLIRCLLLPALIIALSGLIGPLSANELTVSPPRIELTVEPGRTIEDNIMVTGRFAQPTRIRIRAADYSLRENGDFRLEAPGAQPRSLAKWLSVSPAEFVLAGNRAQRVNYRLKFPAEIAGGYWGAVLVESLPPAPDLQDAKVGVTVAARVAVILYAKTARGGVLDGRVTDVSAQWRPEGRLDLAATFVNDGNLMARIKGRFEIRSAAENKTLAKIPFEDLPVLPGGTRRLTAQRPGRLDPGNYLVLVMVDFGGRHIVAGQRLVKVI